MFSYFSTERLNQVAAALKGTLVGLAAGGTIAIIIGTPFGAGAVAGALTGSIITLTGINNESAKKGLAVGATGVRLLAFDIAAAGNGFNALKLLGDGAKDAIGSAANIVVILTAPFNAIEHFSEGKKLWDEDKKAAAAGEITKGGLITVIGGSVLAIQAGWISAHASVPVFLGILASVAAESKVLVFPKSPTVGLSLFEFCATFGPALGLASSHPTAAGGLFLASTLGASTALTAIAFPEKFECIDKPITDALHRGCTPLMKYLGHVSTAPTVATPSYLELPECQA